MTQLIREREDEAGRRDGTAIFHEAERSGGTCLTKLTAELQ